MAEHYSKRLQRDLDEKDERIAQLEGRLRDFKASLLHDPKFVGLDPDGSRRDWISTGDVADRIDAMMRED